MPANRPESSSVGDTGGSFRPENETDPSPVGVDACWGVLGTRLSRSFFARSVLQVARDCIGRGLVRSTAEGTTAGIIVETEAYRGPEDLAAHSRGGRRTPRTEVMFGVAGHAYVFLVYGMHWHFNLVTGCEGEPHAVLVRAVEPVAGQRLMARRRGRDALHELTSGPGKLCAAFAIAGDDYGVDLCRGGTLYLTEGAPRRRVSRARRIGVDYAGAWAARPWRFFDKESPYVSRAPRARSAA